MIFLFLVNMLASSAQAITAESSTAASLTAKNLSVIAYSKPWLNLLYYQATSDGFNSSVSKPIFFLDKQHGPTNPLKELEADLAAFQSDLPLGDNHPQCLFPGRYTFLKKHFALRPSVLCEKFNAWRDHYSPEKLELVYASQYVSNPASVFGHSFLLLPSSRVTKGFWLTFNFAASIPADSSGFGYVYGGLTGWFKGDYTTMPFYNRLYQYGAIENRDLWLFKLKLSQSELDFFIAHMWELVHTADFTYYFLDENCAGALIKTFAATLFDMQDSTRLGFYVHPIEVVKALDRVGRIASVEFVPSQANILKASVEVLDSEQRNQFNFAIRNPHIALSSSDLGDSGAVSEAIIQYTSYVTKKNHGDLPAELKELERDAYIHRSRSSHSSLQVFATGVKEPTPKDSHNSMATTFGSSSVNGKLVLDFGYRFAIHDVLDPEPGFLKNSAIEILSLNLSATPNKLLLRNLTFVNLESYQPYAIYNSNESWKVNASLSENLVTPNESDLFVRFNGGYGVSHSPKLIENAQTYFALLSADINAGKDLPQSKIEIGPDLGMILSFEKIKASASVSYGYGLFESHDNRFLRLSTGFRYRLSQSVSILHKMEWSRLIDKNLEGNRMSLGVRYYF